MMNCSIIGAGQLGSRHLQGLLGYTKEILNIYVVEPNIDSTNLAISRASEVTHNHRLYYCKDISELPLDLEFVVIATNANIRFNIIEKLLERSRVKFLLLEKVLFQNLEHYNKANQIIDNYNIRCFVNHTRRIHESYKFLKNRIIKSQNFNFQVYGAMWGLGTSALHFIDLFEYLTDTKLKQVTCNFLDPSPISSKRSGFIEFEGTVQGVLGDGSLFSITSNKDSELSLPTISLMSNNDRIMIQEYLCPKIYLLSKENSFQLDILEFKNEFQSQLTGAVFDSLQNSGTCGLPTLKDASQTHKIFIRALLDHLNQNSTIFYTDLPIT